jgi:Helix-turn-helix domain
VIVKIQLSDDDIERLAARIARLLTSSDAPRDPAWLDVAGAGAHLGLSEHAVRGLVKRRRVPVHRTENGRLRFSATELDEWVRSGLANSDARTYHDRP